MALQTLERALNKELSLRPRNKDGRVYRKRQSVEFALTRNICERLAAQFMREQLLYPLHLGGGKHLRGMSERPGSARIERVLDEHSGFNTGSFNHTGAQLDTNRVDCRGDRAHWTTFAPKR
jgi:hypothetical protein